MNDFKQSKWAITQAIAFILVIGGNIWWVAQKDKEILDMQVTLEKVSSDNRIMQQVNMERDIKQNSESVAAIAISVKELADVIRELANNKVDMGGYVDQQQFDNYMNHVSDKFNDVAREMADKPNDSDLSEITAQIARKADVSDINIISNKLNGVVYTRDLKDLDAKVERYERSLSGGLNGTKRNIEKLDGLTFEMEERLAEIEDNLGL